jgi:hypothetical protein
MGSVYGVISIVWSLAGFLEPVPPVHFHEYSLASFTTEVGGHLLWGFVAALPSLDPTLILLVMGESILIDLDHVLPVLNLPVEPRLAHSISFALLAALLLAYLGRRGAKLDRGILFATLGSVAGHFSYDIYAGYALFPVLAPLTTAYFSFPFYAWYPFEASALVLCLLSWFPRNLRSVAPKAVC